MQPKLSKALQLKPHFLLSGRSLFLNPVIETNNIFQNTNFTPKFQFFQCSLSRSHKTHIQKPIVCAKRAKSRSGFQREKKFMFQLISILACNLKILQQPLDLVIEEFNGGDGGVLGFLNGFGGGGGFGWWRRRKKANLGFIVCLVIFGSLFLLYGRELRHDEFYGVLSLGLFGIVFIKGFKRNVKKWIFGLCCFGALMRLGLRKEEAMKLINEFKVCAPMVDILRSSKRRGRRGSL